MSDHRTSHRARLFLFAAPPLKAGTTRRTVTVDGVPHTYWLRVPSPQEGVGPLPLVVLCAPPGISPQNAMKRSGWDTRAESVGFLIATPEEVSPAIVESLVEDIQKATAVDSRRLYLVGSRAPLSRRFAAAAWPVEGSDTVQPPAETATLAYPMNTPPDSLALWEFLEKHPRFTGKPGLTRLTVRVSGIRNDKGSLTFTLFSGKDGFPDDAKKARKSGTLPASEGTATLTFDQLPPGDYALTLLHDEDNDGKMTTSLGFPLEGFAVSNNPKVRMGPPLFAEARFYIAGDTPERQISLRMTYLNNPFPR